MKTRLLILTTLGLLWSAGSLHAGDGAPPAGQAPVAPVVKASDCLGTEIWIENDDNQQRIDRLFAAAADSGHGWVRIFLMWPYIEEKPGTWDFRRFDWAFDAAAKHGIKIKATLTANSGPWHIGTPAMPHSHTGFLSPQQRAPMREYIRRCVERYHRHPALGQWILWNEPADSNDQTPERLQFWRAWLKSHFAGQIEPLNHQWYTGYHDFGEIPFPAEVPYPSHRGNGWNRYGPWLADRQARTDWLLDELKWVRDEVRRIDQKTETCVNPPGIFSNDATTGRDYPRMADLVDTLGASFHPCWHFTYAPRSQAPALIAAGVRYLAAASDGKPVEVTEVQTGNTVGSGRRMDGVRPDEVARFYLAGLAAGAGSVTGWCLNVRQAEREAGDWALLDNFDQPSPRSRMLKRVHDVLEIAFASTGRWKAAGNRALVLGHPKSQAIEAVEGRLDGSLPGRATTDGILGQSLLTTALMQCGVPTSLAYLDRVNDKTITPDGLLVVSHVLAWDKEDGQRMLRFAENGGRLLLDAASGRRDSLARMHNPWPGGLAERIGLHVADIEGRADGHPVELYGRTAGKFLFARLSAVFDDPTSWSAWEQPRFQEDGAPLVWERTYGKGRIILVRGDLGASYRYDPDTLPAIYAILRRASQGLSGTICPVSPVDAVSTIPVAVQRGALTAVLAENTLGRQGRPVHLHASRGKYHDFWSGQDMATGADGELTLDCPEGIALLWTAGE